MQKKALASYRSDQRKQWSRRLPFFIYFEQHRGETKEVVMSRLQTQRDEWGILSRYMGDKYIDMFRSYLISKEVNGTANGRFKLVLND